VSKSYLPPASLGILLELWADAVLETVATVPAAPANAVMLAFLIKVLLFIPTIFGIVIPFGYLTHCDSNEVPGFALSATKLAPLLLVSS
jgi:hypothetical protein